MPRVVRRPLAGADITEIWDYIAADSVAAADAWVDGLDRQLQSLAGQPMTGRSREELSEGLRGMPFGRYVIFYLLLSDGIDVVRVLHSGRDVDAVFGRGPTDG